MIQKFARWVLRKELARCASRYEESVSFAVRSHHERSALRAELAVLRRKVATQEVRVVHHVLQKYTVRAEALAAAGLDPKEWQ